MDIYQRLTEDHDRQRELASRLAETTDAGEQRDSLWERLKAEVEAHAAAEEQTFYATLIEYPDGHEKARHSISEHKDAADLIEELSGMDQSSESWLKKFNKLKDELEHHVDEEEAEVFELARSLIDAKQAEALGKDFDRRKKAELDKV